MLCATANHSELDETKVAPIAKVLDLKPIPSRLHGLTAKGLLIGPEDREEFDAMLADFESDVAPQGAIQPNPLR